jgi:hypothetical protein
MSDIADRAGAESGPKLDADIGNIRLAAAAIPAGEPGECERCGEHFARLVGGACGRCRDKYKLP